MQNNSKEFEGIRRTSKVGKQIRRNSKEQGRTPRAYETPDPDPREVHAETAPLLRVRDREGADARAQPDVPLVVPLHPGGHGGVELPPDVPPARSVRVVAPVFGGLCKHLVLLVGARAGRVLHGRVVHLPILT